MDIINSLQSKAIIGMVHVKALPGTPRHQAPISEIIFDACAEAKLYQDYGLDAIILENMHDLPYLNRRVGEEITATMTAVAFAVRQVFTRPIGIQILAGANRAALAVANAAGLDFIRAEGFVFGHLADEGYMDSDAGELLRYRKLIGAERIRIFTDIRKKHSSHAITGDLSLSEIAKAAEFFSADGMIITGSSTGTEAAADDLVETRGATGLPILIGSGITAENIEKYWHLADGFIIGSHFKEQGNWANNISTQRLEDFVGKVKKLRNS